MARSHGLKAKTLRRMLKKKGMKTTGKKATLMKRLHMRGGVGSEDVKSGTSDADAALDSEPEFAEDSSSGSSAATTPAAAAASGSSGAAAGEGAASAGRRRRRSRRREEGGRRRKHTARKEMLGY
uniref:SAP domain-containing protein n=1 Tax=viral metagenome TaxID=1070528 RepID=A0A6C0JFW7_9ZZZZ